MSATEADAGDADDVEAPEELTTIIRAEVLGQVIDQMKTVVGEAILHIGYDGLRVRAVDRSNVAMVDINLEESAFESVGDGKFPIGIDLDRLDDYLSNASGSDLVTLAYKEETRMLNVRHNNVNVDVAAIDPASIREEPDIPELEPDATFTLPASEFQTAVRNADLVTDHIDLVADVEERSLQVIGKGDMDTIETNFGTEDLVEGNFESDVEALYSVEYFRGDYGVLSPIPASAEIQFEYSTERPVILSYEFADGHGSVECMVAPRIQNK